MADFNFTNGYTPGCQFEFRVYYPACGFEFSNGYVPSCQFNFAGGIPLTGETYNATIDISLPVPNVDIDFSQVIINSNINIDLLPPNIDINLDSFEYNIDVNITHDPPIIDVVSVVRPPNQKVAIGCNTSVPAIHHEHIVCSTVEQNTRSGIDVCNPTDEGTYVESILCETVEDLTKSQTTVCITHDDATWLSDLRCAKTDVLNHASSAICSALEAGRRIFDAWCMPVNQTYHASDNYCAPTQDAEQLSHNVCDILDIVERSSGTWCNPIEDGTFEWNGNIPFNYGDPEPPDPDPPSGTTIIVPEQDTYTMLNTITCTLSDGTTPVPISRANLSYDVKSMAWLFDAELVDPSSVSLIEPQVNGQGTLVYLTINGKTWHLLVETIDETIRFGSTTVNISGRGLTALLTEPYVQKTSGVETTLRSIEQLVEDHLPIGWTVTWDMGYTWVIPGDVYTWQNMSPMEAIKRILDDIGAVMVPTTDAQHFTVRKRFPVLPWNYGIVGPDIIIPDNVVTEISRKPAAGWRANGVYVHGLDNGGELAFCRLNGTAGDQLATTVTNQLMTSADALRMKGEEVLSITSHDQEVTNITTFFDNSIMPLVDIGDFVRFTWNGSNYHGIASAVRIQASLQSISQSISFDDGGDNILASFDELVKGQPMVVGQVVSVSGNTGVVQLYDGYQIRITEPGLTIGNKYYIRDGAVIAPAPNLTSHVLVI